MGHEAGPALVADRRILRLITEGVERNSLRRHFRTVRAPGPNVRGHECQESQKCRSALTASEQ